MYIDVRVGVSVCILSFYQYRSANAVLAVNNHVDIKNTVTWDMMWADVQLKVVCVT